MDERARLQQFYLRTVLAVGLLWGAFLLVQLLELALTPGTKGSFVNALAVVVNCLSVFPACILAFWHRRAACVWLGLNAGFITATTIRTILHTHQVYGGFTFGVLLSIALTITLIVIEVRGWPGALARDRH
jgi:hypothetical protein